MSKEYILGIDPGLKGGLCLMEIGTRKIQTYSFSCGENEQIHESDCVKFEEMAWSQIPQIGIENPPLYVPGGGNNGATSAKLRESYGFWRGFTFTNPLFRLSKFHFLTPQRWQKMYGVPKGKEHKRALAHAAMNLYPELEKMKTGELQAVCDAVLICHFLHTHLY